MSCSFIGLVLSFYIGGVTCLVSHSMSAVEGESPTIDCGFQTSVDGGNLMWRAISTDSETLLGHIVPGDHFCGTDTLACTVHTSGSITLVNITMDDGDKRYRCLRGDEEGYHYFSEVNLIVLSKGVTPPIDHSVQSVVEGESPTIDCGFQTSVDGGNLMWRAISTDSETLLGHIVPGDHFCGTDTVACTVHINGSITLVDVTVDDGDKRYRCLRGDTEGYHYFSDFNLTVLAKGTIGHTLINEVTESVPESRTIGEKSVIYCYDQPTCKDDEDGALIVTCYPPSGEMIDKVFDQVHCHAELKENCVTVIAAIAVACIIVMMILVFLVILCIRLMCEIKNAMSPEHSVACCLTSSVKGITGRSNRSLSQHDEEALQLNPVMNTHSQTPDDTEPESGDNSDEIAKLMNEKMNADMSYERKRLTEKETECADTSEELNKVKVIIQQKDREISDLRKRMTEKETECTDTSEELNEVEEVNQQKDTEISDLRQRLTSKETECTDTPEELNEVKEIYQQKDMDISDLRQRMTEKETKCTDTSEELNKIEEINQQKDMDISDLRQRMTKKETECTDTSEKLNEGEEINQQEPVFTMELEEEYFQHTGCKNTDSLQFMHYLHEDLLIGIQCELCLSEWVVKEYLPPNNLGEELMFTGGRQLHVLKKPYVDESTFRVELKETEIRDILNLADYLSPGDHIKYTSCLGFL